MKPRFKPQTSWSITAAASKTHKNKLRRSTKPCSRKRKLKARDCSKQHIAPFHTPISLRTQISPVCSLRYGAIPESIGRQRHVQSELVDCPNCRLVNPPDATRCDCGYDFQKHTVEKSYPPEPKMFDYYQPQEKESTDYTGLKITAILA